MQNVTKIQINRPSHEIFEAFVDPVKIGNFWFSSSSRRWAAGQTVTLRYKEYNASGDITIRKLEEDKSIVFEWGTDGSGHVVAIRLVEIDSNKTIVEVVEDGFDESFEDFVPMVLDNKEGWVYTLTCLKGYLESGITSLRASLVKG